MSCNSRDWYKNGYRYEVNKSGHPVVIVVAESTILMQDTKFVIAFLEDLSDNNSKSWMDDNRSRYHKAKDIWLEQVQTILTRLTDLNPDFALVQPKSTISRINNNRRFQPNKPVYKDFLSCDLSGKGIVRSMFYFGIGKTWSFVGGGLHNPEKEQLSAFRNAIDYDGQEFHDLQHAPAFQQFFGGLTSFKSSLKTAPRGYPKDHQWIEYLRLTSIAATKPLTKRDILSDSFPDIIAEAYQAFRPMELYLEKVIEFEAGE